MTDESPETQKKRAWLRLHRSTWIAMAIVGVPLVMLNLRSYFEADWVFANSYGFPCHCLAFVTSFEGVKSIWWSLPGFLLDAATAAAFLFLATVAAQWFRTKALARNAPEDSAAPQVSRARPRPWAHLHLSTCVVLMAVASVVVWLNLSEQWARSEVNLPVFTEHAPVIGWPNAAWFGEGDVRIVSRCPCPGGSTVYMRYQMMDLGVILDWVLPDLSVALALLVWAAVPCELAIRLRKDRPGVFYAGSPARQNESTAP